MRISRRRAAVDVGWTRGLINARLTAVMLLSALACSSNEASPTEPRSAPYMAGRITSITASGTQIARVRIEANPASTSEGLKAVATVDPLTVILLPDKSTGSLRSLATGQWVRLWFDGAITDSYPVQGTAATIAIDSTGVSVLRDLP